MKNQRADRQIDRSALISMSFIPMTLSEGCFIGIWMFLILLPANLLPTGSIITTKSS
ncbi:MAG: hypothetical protein K6F95_12110 [Selenomonas sp.]|uniref:hypothetical protein n=1 Tax=Selenomonas sp. TaxID=2053611 RepID=UPI0025F9CDA8|nr:hypothetical protein [Selenomonas sp.]MCR5758627.1 hypothetical protein [Selenomonas sp.]